MRVPVNILKHHYYSRAWERTFLGGNEGIRRFSQKKAFRKKGGREDEFCTFVYDTPNIGDNIQTIAQLGFLPEGADVVSVSRDELNKYEGESRYCIMNGWFTHSPGNWPPGEKINPLFVSFHISRNQIASKKYRAFYKKHEPIGCRDQATVRKLKKIGVDAVFTGCLTLTLNNPNEGRRGDDVVVCESHLEGDHLPSAPRLFERLIPSDIKRDAKYVRHGVRNKHKNNYVYKTRKALRLLDLYSTAKLVITSRLHCALPCIAMGTPVVFLHEEWSSDERFEGYREILNGYGPSANEIDVNWNQPVPADVEGIKENITTFVERKFEEMG